LAGLILNIAFPSPFSVGGPPTSLRVVSFVILIPAQHLARSRDWHRPVRRVKAVLAQRGRGAVKGLRCQLGRVQQQGEDTVVVKGPQRGMMCEKTLLGRSARGR
jgi:hypothetical protein